MVAVPVSKAELDFTFEALRREGIRVDGRALVACRRLGVRFGAAHGEVEVTFGPTRASAVCSGEIVTPQHERPNEGRISFHVEFGPIASPSFDAGQRSMQATAVGNLIERLIRGSRAVDAEALCIVGGQKVWSIRVDVRALDDDGNLGDVCAVAALCSLLHFRRSDVEVRGGAAKIFSWDERVPVPLSIHHLPIPVTFALFAACTKGDREPAEPIWVLDPNRLEESAMNGALCIAVNQHGELCGVHKPGGMPIDFALLQNCIEIAKARARELTGRIQAELAADLARRQEARRNVHQHFAEGQLLTVEWEPAASLKDTPAEARISGAPAAQRPAEPRITATPPPRQRPHQRGPGAPGAPGAAAAGGSTPGASGAAAAQRPEGAPGSSRARRSRSRPCRGPGGEELARRASGGGSAQIEDDGCDIDAELEAVAAEAAELEEQLAAVESAEIAAAAEAGLVTALARGHPAKKVDSVGRVTGGADGQIGIDRVVPRGRKRRPRAK